MLSELTPCLYMSHGNILPGRSLLENIRAWTSIRELHKLCVAHGKEAPYMPPLSHPARIEPDLSDLRLEEGWYCMEAYKHAYHEVQHHVFGMAA